MKQSDDPDKFFEKYKFRSSIEMPHPEHKDTMKFEGLEADYVNALENKIVNLEKYISYQHEKIDFLMNKTILKLKKTMHPKDEE